MSQKTCLMAEGMSGYEGLPDKPFEDQANQGAILRAESSRDFFLP